MFMRYAKGNKGTLRVGKNGVSLKFYGQELQYWNEELWRLYYGQDVYVRYAPDDLSSVRVYNLEKQFICTAELKTAIGYRATKDEIRAATAENRRAVKTVRAYKQQKGIEAENELRLILDAAAGNMDDFSIDAPLQEQHLILTRNVTDYEVDISLGGTTGYASKGGSYADAFASHAHTFSGTKKAVFRNALVSGDQVVLLRLQGGKKFLVLDRIKPISSFEGEWV